MDQRYGSDRHPSNRHFHSGFLPTLLSDPTFRLYIFIEHHSTPAIYPKVADQAGANILAGQTWPGGVGIEEETGLVSPIQPDDRV
ncbi:hypothetical protein [Sphingomonas echinoides]|uniref:hypothetical protein n=1 Tax=Sphingomonas echinoides TaxID=59803 RepID=UPI00241390C9|nr:hypothetical protein [Sphingomonas echinoides]